MNRTLTGFVLIAASFSFFADTASSQPKDERQYVISSSPQGVVPGQPAMTVGLGGIVYVIQAENSQRGANYSQSIVSAVSGHQGELIWKVTVEGSAMKVLAGERRIYVIAYTAAAPEPYRGKPTSPVRDSFRVYFLDPANGHCLRTVDIDRQLSSLKLEQQEGRELIYVLSRERTFLLSKKGPQWIVGPDCLTVYDAEGDHVKSLQLPR